MTTDWGTDEDGNLERGNAGFSALEALARLEATLPKKTAGDQFREFDVGQAFTTANPNTFTFVKTAENSVTRIHRATGAVTYSGDATYSFNWDDPTAGALIPSEEY